MTDHFIDQRRRDGMRTLPEDCAETIVQNTTEGIVFADTRGVISFVNFALAKLLGYAAAEMLGRGWQEFVLPAHRNLAIAAEMRRATGTSERYELLLQRKDGTAVWTLVGACARKDPATGTYLGSIGVISDISAQKAHEAELDHIANFDPLTGIPNRRLLTDRMHQALALARRTGERLAVVMLDLDGFKPVNDRWGHEAGDAVLAEIARRLRLLLRAEDTVARLGGDEFVLLLRHVENESVFERVLDAIRQPVEVEGGTASVSASLGVAFFDAAAPVDGDQLLRMADQAAYRAKAAGKDRFVMFGAGTEADVKILP